MKRIASGNADGIQESESRSPTKGTSGGGEGQQPRSEEFLQQLCPPSRQVSAVSDGGYMNAGMMSPLVDPNHNFSRQFSANSNASNSSMRVGPPGLSAAPAYSRSAQPSSSSADWSSVPQQPGTPVAGNTHDPSLQMLSYTENPAGGDLGVQTLTLVAGVRVHIAARVHVAKETWWKLEDRALFTVKPPLPEGLNLHPYSGHISGLPMQAQEVASEHIITINIAAVGPGGNIVDTVTLTCCTIVVRIVDVRCYMLNSATETMSEHGGVQLVIRLQGPT
jgi:hypothetical protein